MRHGGGGDGFKDEGGHSHDNVENIRTDNIDIAHMDRMDLSILHQGSMGLKGVWALVGNSTAMVILAVVMFYSLRQVNMMHRESMDMLKNILDKQAEMQSTTIKDNTQAIKDLSMEIKSLSVKMERRKFVEP